MANKTIHINVPLLARVEGEGSLDVDIAGGKINRLNLKIFEPPRLFEKLLVGRQYHEVPDAVARICGICPVAYQISAVLAIEKIFQMRMPTWIEDMRRVFYCGEWIQSHALHIHLLALPDYFSVNSVVELAQRFPDEVRRGMELQALGNQIIKLFAARSINPVGIQVGGFSHSPAAKNVQHLLERIEQQEQAALDLLNWVCHLEKPEHAQELLQFSLRESNNYPMMSRTLQGSQGQCHDIDDYTQYFEESQQPYSTAFHSLYQQQAYLLGPLARFNLNYSLLDYKIEQILTANNIRAPLPNNYYSIIARAAEICQALLTAKNLLQNYQENKPASVAVTPKAGVASGCSEAPRGFLWHRYEISEQGSVVSANIVAPTSQNQAQIEQDIKWTLEKNGLDQAPDELKRIAEQVIRNYDPCISCATHFLTLRIHRD